MAADEAARRRVCAMIQHRLSVPCRDVRLWLLLGKLGLSSQEPARHDVANLCPDGFGELEATTQAKLNSHQRRNSIVAVCRIRTDLLKWYEVE